LALFFQQSKQGTHKTQPQKIGICGKKKEKKKKNPHIMLLAFGFVGLGERSLAGGQTLTGKRRRKDAQRFHNAALDATTTF